MKKRARSMLLMRQEPLWPKEWSSGAVALGGQGCIVKIDGNKLWRQIDRIQAVYDALSAPLRQISENAGEEPSVVVYKGLEKIRTFGYNARNKEYVDLLRKE